MHVLRLQAFLFVLPFALALVTIGRGEDQLPAAAEREVDFARDIQPLFQAACHSCHGPEVEESGLRLDVKRRALEGGDGGTVVAPGSAAESRLLRIVAGLDDEVGQMPPEGEGTPLTDEQIAVLRAWIEQGARWPDEADAALAGTEHWSFQAIQRPGAPHVQNRLWLANPIDAFILARLESAGIEPSPPADRATLIRRLYLDLLGLPPSPAAVDAFVNDSRPDAYERLVDRTFASPHFGERWARHWLDLARYADSDGYEKDRARPHAWRYRHWVIDMINADLPFDRFTVEQLAGDMLADSTTPQQVASGFHRNTLHNTEGGTDPEEDRVKKTVDRTNTVGTIWLGLSVGCAQCHSHKYDPLTQREYYSLYGFFNSINEMDIDAPLDVDRERYELARQAFDRQHAVLQAAVDEYEQSQLPAALAAWETSALGTATVWQTLEPAAAVSRHGAQLERQDDGSLLASGKNIASDVYTVEAIVDGPVTAIQLEVLPDEGLVKKGPGRADNGNFVLTSFRVQAAPASGDVEPDAVSLHRAQADFSQNDWPVAAAINDDPADGWAVSPQFGQRHVAVFECQEPVSFDSPARLIITLDQSYQGKTHNLGRFRLSVTNTAAPVTLEGMPAEVARALELAAEQRTPEQQAQVLDYYRGIDSELAKLKKIVADHARKAPAAPGTKAQTVVQTDEARATRVHIRGDFLNQGEPVQPQTPAVLHALESRGGQGDRLDLAHWIVAEENPLMARVTVNRIWQRIFGRGIVASVDDFGTQGDAPSHPQLLDWLASEFRESGWSVKHIQRLIVTSAAYRQSSALRGELAATDPENVLLARQTRRRVEAEVIRDLALAVSGLWDPRVGGPSVRPQQPSEYSALTYANSARWEVSKEGDAYRRGLYTFFQRTSPYPMLMTFDAPDSNECCARRDLSNTPLQALTLWNDPVFFQCAQALGRRVVRETRRLEGPSAMRQRAAHAFQVCLARRPSEGELDAVVELLAAQLELGRQSPEMAEAIVGPQPRPESVSVEELAAWIVLGRTLINLDQFITRE